MEKIENELCPFCHTKNLTLTEEEIDIPYFGKVCLFSMQCSNCKANKSDVEPLEKKDPCRYSITIDNNKDMKIRIVKSSTATVKIPNLRLSVTPGPASEGYVSNIEGVLNRFKKVIEDERDIADDPDIKKKSKNLLKKMWKVKCGDIPIKVIIEDPEGNSAIISKKAVFEKLNKK